METKLKLFNEKKIVLSGMQMRKIGILRRGRRCRSD